MCHGSLFSKLLRFSLPLILSGILQLLFNAADLIVVGNYSSHQALSAIGAVGSLINFFVNLIIGISVGSNVVVARNYSVGNKEAVGKAVHTSILTALLAGLFVGLLGVLFSRPILKLMDTPADVIELSALYVMIYFAGLPFSMLYNFGSSILRAVGDTKRPLFFLSLAGVFNVGLNLLFVTQCHMSVEGVALATLLSQALSAILVMRCLIKSEGLYKLSISALHIDRKTLQQILGIGLPAGIQSVIFSISNILIQSSINFFGSVAMAGNTAASSVESFVYTSMNAVYQTNLSFSSQNYGIGNYKRMRKCLLYCFLIVTAVGLLMGCGAYLFSSNLVALYNHDPEVVVYGIGRCKVICTTYCLCGIMEVICGSLRAMGYGILPMVVSLIGACGLRVLWILTYFQSHHTLNVLYSSYPITWTITILAHLISFLIVSRHLPKTDASV
ncbi:MAG: MATE family efflux transporter [Lachnospiraceae bacterium]|nr:MATE family efflux transporter [Lachnospiraceae bacterium]